MGGDATRFSAVGSTVIFYAVKHAHRKHTEDLLAGIEVERREMVDIYTGAQETLIKANLATPEMFPVWPKRCMWGGPKPRVDEEWRIDRVRGGRFRLTRWHEYREPPKLPPTPVEYKRHLARFATAFMDVLVVCARDARLSEEDIQRIISLRERLVDVILKARVVSDRALAEGAKRSMT